MVAYDSYSSDDDEDKCPLCIEDMDITDRNFKPCPCGFQLCQFCYNNIRSGPEQYNRCPACRRPYDDASIEYKTFTPEEIKQEQERKQRKELERKQREREKNKETHFDQRDKKHLANVRVIQKNLVYVIGLNPNIPSEELQQMLRRDEFFGQYGKIQKIVVNKRVNGNGNLGVGVYVTFARKEDAARCIAAVDGSVNDGKYLRAAYGTTKYCSSYLRGQNCLNQNCMFLHEPGEEADSFNRHPNHAPGSASGSTPVSPAVSNAALPQIVSGAGSTSGTGAAATPGSGASGLGSAAAGGAGAAGSSPAPHASGSATSQVVGAHQPIPPGATLQAANVPALPAWGKYTPQIPQVQKLTGHDLPNPAGVALSLLTRNLSSLNPSQWNYRFVSDLVDVDSKFPAMFSLPMDDKRRLKAYNKAIAELDRLLPRQATPGDSDASQSQGLDAERPPSHSPANSTKSDSKRNNSQHLLAHLMRDVNSASPQPERQGEDSRASAAARDSPDRPTARKADRKADAKGDTKGDAKDAKSDAKSDAKGSSKGEPRETEESTQPSTQPIPQHAGIDAAAVSALLDKHAGRDALHGLVADTIRQIGSDLMQPPEPVKVEAPENIAFGPSRLRDDGPAFDLKKIPHVPMAGDVEPSVWSAVEELGRQRELFTRQKDEFSAAKAQSKKRMKRIRV